MRPHFLQMCESNSVEQRESSQQFLLGKSVFTKIKKMNFDLYLTSYKKKKTNAKWVMDLNRKLKPKHFWIKPNRIFFSSLVTHTFLRYDTKNIFHKKTNLTKGTSKLKSSALWKEEKLHTGRKYYKSSIINI